MLLLLKGRENTMHELLKPETLEALRTIIVAASQSYLGYAALATIVAAVAFYFINAFKNGVTLLNLAAFGLLLMFMILAGAAAYYSAANVIQTLYYAGRDGDSFNVGKFVRTSPTEWEDRILARAALDGTGKPLDRLVWHYKIDNGTTDTRLLLKGTDEGREGVVIEVDMDLKEINYIENNQLVHQLYHIIAP
jgi:hypothetical protein